MSLVIEPTQPVLSREHAPMGPDQHDKSSVSDGGFDADGFGRELDAVRAEVLASLGEADAAYIRRLIKWQRRLEVGGRVALMGWVVPPIWAAGVAMLSLSKILENMEIGHNVMHAQWDWMRDPDIHSTTWEWDNVCPSSQWQFTHNHMHHQWTNVRHMDRDIGYGFLRVDPDQKWKKAYLTQPLRFVALGLFFEYGVGLHDTASELAWGEEPRKANGIAKLTVALRKIRSQVLKDYVVFPLLALPFGLPTALGVLGGTFIANIVRNVWSFAVIFCGHFPDDVTYFDQDVIDGETRGDWYHRQVLGSANFTGGPLMHLMSGNLDHQIEHHLFPDLPSNRYSEIAPKVREICERHGVAYNTGSFARQFGTVVRKIFRLALPN